MPKARSSHAEKRDARNERTPLRARNAYDDNTIESTTMVVNTRMKSCKNTERRGSMN